VEWRPSPRQGVEAGRRHEALRVRVVDVDEVVERGAVLEDDDVIQGATVELDLGEASKRT
jgi:hypothetical protein